MAKPSNIADVSEVLSEGSEVQAPLDSALDELIGYAMRRAQLKLFQNLIGRLSAHDLRPAQFSALAIIDQNPGLMQADLARALAIEPPQVVPLLNKAGKPRPGGTGALQAGQALLWDLPQQDRRDPTQEAQGNRRTERPRLHCRLGRSGT